MNSYLFKFKPFTDETNRQSLSYLETCLYVLCLDESVTTNSPPSKNQRLDSIQNIELDRQEPSYIAAMLLHGGGSEFNSANRWFDKFLQVNNFSFALL